jgi:hypothetical protein
LVNHCHLSLEIDLKARDMRAVANVVHQDPSATDEQRKSCRELLDDVGQLGAHLKPPS